jgi:CRISPR system Cascade subunit CasC
MGSLEFNSATYYRYISIDLGQLWETLSGHNFEEIVLTFIKALFLAVPSARQTTQSGASPWEFAKVFIRQGQRLQAPFETAVKAIDGGFLQPSIDSLCSYLEKKEKMAGSLFKMDSSYTLGQEDIDFNIDNLVSAISRYIKEKIS